jgi:hypothetical protein
MDAKRIFISHATADDAFVRDLRQALWLRREIRKALEVEKAGGEEDYRVIPLLLASIEPAALDCITYQTPALSGPPAASKWIGSNSSR